MTVSRTIDLPLTARARHVFQHPDLKLRRALVGLESLEPALRSNGRDEIVVRDRSGQLYVVDAVELRLGHGEGSPQPGDRFSLAGIEGDIVLADIDPPRGRGFPGIAALGASVVGAPLAAKAVTLAFGSGVLGLGMTLAAAVVGLGVLTGLAFEHRSADDSALAKLTTTLATSREGDFEEIEAQLRPPAPSEPT